MSAEKGEPSANKVTIPLQIHSSRSIFSIIIVILLNQSRASKFSKVPEETGARAEQGVLSRSRAYRLIIFLATLLPESQQAYRAVSREPQFCGRRACTERRKGVD